MSWSHIWRTLDLKVGGQLFESRPFRYVFSFSDDDDDDGGGGGGDGDDELSN